MSGVEGVHEIHHGPYHRKQSRTQTKADADNQARGHTLLGRAARGSGMLSAKAYVGSLPAGQAGIEFLSVTPRHGTHPYLAFWYEGNQDVWNVTHDGDAFAMIVIKVTKIQYP